MEIGNSKTKWILIGFFVVGFLAFFHFAIGDVNLFFALIGIIVVASSVIYLTSRNFFKTLLGFIVILILFAFGIWSSEKITAFAQSQPPRQVEEIIIDGQDTSLVIPQESTEIASGEPLSTFTSGNCVSASFPESIRQWCPLIETNAEKYNIDPHLIASVMLQESGGNPQASSKDGAIGLLQVMPRDGISASFQCINGPCFSSRPSMEELYDPEFNIEYGTKMLAGLIIKHGSVRDALLKYGPSGVGYGYADKILKIHETY